MEKTKTIRTRNGGSKKVTPSGRTTEEMTKQPDGQHTQIFSPTGRVQREEVQKRDGSHQTTAYAPTGRVQREEVQKRGGSHQTTVYAPDGKKPRQQVVVNKDSTQTTNFRYDRDGKERARETVNTDARGRPVSKTVVVKQTTIIRNTTINSEIVRNYDRGRLGFVYRPVYVAHSPVFVSWYQPYRPFHYAWGWEDSGWYRYHAHYWAPYEVYPAPSYWVTDWLIAGYVADRYAASVSEAQAREDLRIAQEDAINAREAALRAQGAVEIADAHTAQADAERRATIAEAKAEKARAEEARAEGNQPNPNATPIDDATKRALNDQIEKTIAEKKEFAEQSEKGGKPVVPDVFIALADPNHVYPVSKTISVTRAEDSKPAGILTTGDLLKLGPDHGTLNDTTANENTFVVMRVMTSKGEADAVPAGTLISVPLGDLQDFDNEFRAKLDLGLAEADKNKDLFKQYAVAK